MLADISIELILRMSFLSLSIINIKFANLEKLIQRSYIIVKHLLTTNKVKFNNEKKFIKVVLDENLETFIIYIVALESTEVAIIVIHFLQIAQQIIL